MAKNVGGHYSREGTRRPPDPIEPETPEEFLAWCVERWPGRRVSIEMCLTARADGGISTAWALHVPFRLATDRTVWSAPTLPELRAKVEAALGETT